MTDVRVQGLTSPEVCRRSGVTYRQLSYWTARGVILPSVSTADGSGGSHCWSEADAAVLAIAARAAKLGATTATLARVVEHVRQGVERLAIRADGVVVVDPDWSDLGTAALVVQVEP